MRVAFAYNPLNIRWNHGTAVLSAYAKQVGIDCEIVEIRPGFTGEGFDWVACNFVTVHDYQASLPILAAVPCEKLLAGGIYARKGGEIDPMFQHVCRGEGERLVDFFLTGDTAVFDNALVDQDMDIFPDLLGVTGYEFGRGIPLFTGKRMIPYSSSRGCPNKCSFCEVRNLPQTLRIKTTIKEDLERIRVEYDPDMLYLTDETLPYYHHRWRMQFDGNRTPFLAFIRGDIEPQDLDFLIHNGLHSCAMGVESGDEKYRNEVLHKGVTDYQLYRTAHALDMAGVNRIMFYMRHTPGETDAMRDKTFDMIDKLGGYPMIFEYEVL